MFENFEQMFNHYLRRRIFDWHDYQMLLQGVVHDNDTFLDKIVRPKMHLGRLNYGDFIRILATIF